MPEIVNGRDKTQDFFSSLQRFGIRPGLERMGFMLNGLGNPERGLTVVHLAGTNGKGSTAAMLASIIESAGYRVGLYTSPHLQDYRERIRLNGRMIPEAELAACLAQVRPLLEQTVRMNLDHPTEFEVATACMYLYFSRQKVDLLIQETGLGGGWDSTNLIPAPLLAIITSIGMDHHHILGGSLAAIAAQKAGIIKAGGTVFSAIQEEGAGRVLEDAARRKQARLEFVPPGRRRSGDRTGQWLDLEGYPSVRLNLPGRHQLQNAALAVRAAAWCGENGFAAVDDAAIRRGLANFRWPGRLEHLPGRPELWLDGAHNPPAAKALAESLMDMEMRPVLLVGMLADKDVKNTLAPLLPLCSGLVLTRTESDRGLPAKLLFERIEELLRPDLQVFCQDDPARALAEARQLAGERGSVLVTGSLYLVGAMRDLLGMPAI